MIALHSFSPPTATRPFTCWLPALPPAAAKPATNKNTLANCCRVPIYRVRAVRSQEKKRPEKLLSMGCTINEASCNEAHLDERSFEDTHRRREREEVKWR